MTALLALIFLTTGIISTLAHPASSLEKRDDISVYFSPMFASGMCLTWDPFIHLTPCAAKDTQQWSYNPLVGQESTLYIQNKTCGIGACNHEYCLSCEIDTLTASGNDNTFLWYWTRDSRLQWADTPAYCLSVVGNTQALTMNNCTDATAWAFGVTSTFSSLATGKPKYNVFANTNKGTRVHGLGRADLCLTASALPGDFLSNSPMVLAPCVSDNSLMAKYALFNLTLPSDYPTSTYTGPLTFSIPDKAGATYCVDVGNNPVMGTQLMTSWQCSGGPSQTFVLDEKSLKMSGTDWCAQVIGSGQLPGDEKDFNPMYNVVLNQCDPSNPAQNFWIKAH
ncbi:hypothetical protein TREMEDRAFT_66013 [Tremella mesenterica DSM 1558]|uniref:uncharacterized protein n=1 Tax=Tremella mesenterica (strain ATCC 24925 / CBS 8224 / DSM 1558 / NBRC 9311 / NRRL Y-6157 / RJB 2259-6 / UBC 559-6) TaxID=578456 RepID=UPI00032C21D5|nr:uncharacterized protein TREMEDRAFT_66013 [Tremella mesenterica DSM 1558]EIW65927.1 hypothetical protein TREMEDRAFT_66013 [Tremella mesenterica DSM 1558]